MSDESDQLERARRVMAGGGNLTDKELENYKSVDQWIAGGLRVLLVLDGENQMLYEASSHLSVEDRIELANAILYASSGSDGLRGVQEIMENCLELDGDDTYEYLVDDDVAMQAAEAFLDFMVRSTDKLREHIQYAKEVAESRR